MKKAILILCIFLLALSLAFSVILAEEEANIDDQKIIKVLAIGNSFSEDATTYLQQIAEGAGVKMYVGNMYIGGCSLATHWSNAKSDAKAYTFYKFFDKKSTQNGVSIKQALESQDWDYVVMQQVSNDSGKPETYEPYLSNLSDYVKSIEPDAEQLIHQTWAYDINSTHSGFAYYNKDQETMFNALKDAYNKAAQKIGARLIPCGEAMQKARATAPFDMKNGGKSLCRDGYHASPQGRYLLGAVWFEILTGESIFDSIFTISSLKDEQLEIIKQAAHDAVEEYIKVKSIAIESKPSKTVYEAGESLEIAGGSISVLYDNGREKLINIESSMVTGYDPEKPGEQVITITYEGAEASFAVEVLKPEKNNSSFIIIIAAVAGVIVVAAIFFLVIKFRKK